MLILSIFSTITVLVGAADYSLPASSAPAKYALKKPAAGPVVKASDIALIAKLVEQLQGYGHSLPGPVYIGDGMLTDQSYSETDLSPLLKLLYRGKPKKHGVTATVKYLNPLPGLYGDPSYGIANSHLTAAYKRPALGLGLLHALASPANLLYPHPSPAYVHYGPGPRLPLGPAGIFGYSGYASSPASLAPVPVIIITKKHVDEEEYEGDLAAITESPTPAPADYVLKPKKNVIKVVAPAKKAPASTSYGPGKTKVLSKQTKAKVYSKTNNKPVVVVNKAKNYKKVVKVTVPAESTKMSYSPMTVKATKTYSTTEKPIAAVEMIAPVAVVPVAPKYTGVPTVAPAPVATKYTAVTTIAPAPAAPKYTAVPAVAPAPVAPKYTAVPTVAPAAPAPVAVAKPANDAPSSPDSAETADAASISEPDAGESARASLPETKISSQQTISRIS